MTDNVINFLSHNTEETVTQPSPFSQDSRLYFPVWERPLTFKGQTDEQGNGSLYNVESHKAIVRMHPVDEDKPIAIGIVGKNYKVLPTKDVCQGVERVFMDKLTPEQLEGVKVHDATSYLGAQCIRDYIFPNINADIGSKHSQIAFRTIIINGYDGASSFKFYSGAIDFFCTNGMVSGVFDLVAKRHTSGLQVPALTTRLEKSVDIFYQQAEQWKHWVGKEITDGEAKVAFEAMPGVSERRVAQLLRQFRIECETHGRTVWALYSAATYYSSHNEGEFRIRDTGKDSQATTLNNRELQVRSWTATQDFQRIAA